MLAASIAPSAAPAPTSVCSSSMNSTTSRVELVAACELGQVATELVEQRSLGRLLRSRLGLGLRTRVVQKPLDLGADFVERRAQVFEHVGGDALSLDEQAKQEVLGADIVV